LFASGRQWLRVRDLPQAPPKYAVFPACCPGRPECLGNPCLGQIFGASHTPAAS